MEELRILIAGGGTGGHVFPMLAVADALQEAYKNCRILFAGSHDRIETRLVPEAGYELKTLKVSGIKGKSKISRLAALARLPLAVAQSAYIVSTFGPHAVLSGGGYAAWPACWTAARLGRPLAILEVNSLPGMVSRALSRSAKRAYIAFESAADHLHCETMVTGNPIRSAVRAVGSPPGGERLSVLVIGGSQGAVGLNNLLLEALPQLAGAMDKLRITHQTGELDHQRVTAAYNRHSIEAQVVPFIEDMAAAYSQADIVISRAGATSIAELIAAARPSILVPLPSAADDHQTVNAEEIAGMGGGLVMPQNETSGETLAQQLLDWYDHRSVLNGMRSALQSHARDNSAQIIARDLISLAGKD